MTRIGPATVTESDPSVQKKIFSLFRWYLWATAVILGITSIYFILSAQVWTLTLGVMSAILFLLACIILTFSIWFYDAERVNKILSGVIRKNNFIVYFIVVAGTPLLFYLLYHFSQPVYLLAIKHISKIFPLMVSTLAWLFITTFFLLVHSLLTNHSDLRAPQKIALLFRLYLWASSDILIMTSIYYILSNRYSTLLRGILAIGVLLLAFIIFIYSRRLDNADKTNTLLTAVIRKKNFIVFFIGLAGVLLLFFLLFFVSQPVYLFAVKYVPKTIPLMAAMVVWLFISTLFLGIYIRHKNFALYHVYRNDYLGVILILLQHFLIFKDHYFNNVGFPWDFPLDYYGYTVYWTSLVTKGIMPNWVPFQQMGYPLAMNLQSGIHYPLFWLFPLLGISYTLNAATIFQTLHILFGAIGMYVFLRALGNKPIYACIGAVAFQFFGGFYSTAEDADIIRAFSMVPWLLYSFTLSFRSQSIPKRVLLIPLFIFLMATGGYPGNFIASLAVLAVYSLIQLVILAVSTKSWQKVLSWGICLLSLTFLGAGMTFLHFGPVLFERGYFYRYTNLMPLSRVYAIGIRDLPGLFLTNAALPGEISMKSMFVTLPIMILLFFISWRYLKKSIAIIAVGLFSALMAGGVFWIFLTKEFTPLTFSRFPSSDYRLFLAITLIILALGGLKSILDRQEKVIPILLRTGTIIIGFLIGVFVSLSFVPSNLEEFLRPLNKAEAIQSLILLIITIGAIWAYFRVPRISPKTLTILMGIIILIDGILIVPSMLGWRQPNISNYYEDTFGYSFYDELGNFKPDLFYTQMPNSRPERISNPDNPFSTSMGYFSGQFTMFDWSGNLLANARLVDDNELYRGFMAMPWTPVILPLNAYDGTNPVSVPDDIIQAAIHKTVPPSDIVQDSYGIDEIKYQVKLESPKLLIENEVYFPGWQATLIEESGQKVIQAIPVNQLFRGWLLPAGQYQMIAKFSFPDQSLYVFISMVAVMLWIIVSLSIMGIFRFSVIWHTKTEDGVN